MDHVIIKLNDIKEKNIFSVEEINKITNQEELVFIIKNAIETTAPEYNNKNLFFLFETLRENIFEQGGMNIFQENIILKIIYLKELYNIDSIIFESLIVLKGFLLLDYELEKDFLEKDNFYQFFLKRYNEFKKDNELTILKMLNMISNIEDLPDNIEELQGVFNNLKQLVQTN